MRAALVAVAALNVASWSTAVGQSRLVLPPPTHIRYTVVSSDSSREAEVIAQRGDSLWLRSLLHADTSVVVIPSLTRLDVSLGRHSHGLRGAAIGLLSGAVVGGVWGASMPVPECHDLVCFTPSSRGEQAAVFGGTFALLGAGVGALIGKGQWSERWERVKLPSIATLLVRPRTFGYVVGVKVTAF